MLQIMVNGVIYIGRSYGECCPLKFTALPLDATPFIAPYWIDSDPSVRGNVSYEVHTGNTSLLQQVSDYISSNQSVEFSGTWMIVAYWWDVPELFLDDTVSFEYAQNAICHVICDLHNQYYEYCLPSTQKQTYLSSIT